MSADKGNQWYDGDWEELVDRAEEILTEVASRPGAGRKRNTTFYSELNEDLEEPFDLGSWRGRKGIAVLLAEVSKQSHADRGRMLSAVVLSKSGGMPGQGFFELAREQGWMTHGVRDVDFFIEELRLVHAEYRED